LLQIINGAGQRGLALRAAHPVTLPAEALSQRMPNGAILPAHARANGRQILYRSPAGIYSGAS